MSSSVIADARFRVSFMMLLFLGGHFVLVLSTPVALFSLSTSNNIRFVQAFSDKLLRIKGFCFASKEEPLKSIAIRL